MADNELYHYGVKGMKWGKTTVKPKSTYKSLKRSYDMAKKGVKIGLDIAKKTDTDDKVTLDDFKRAYKYGTAGAKAGYKVSKAVNKASELVNAAKKYTVEKVTGLVNKGVKLVNTIFDKNPSVATLEPEGEETVIVENVIEEMRIDEIKINEIKINEIKINENNVTSWDNAESKGKISTFDSIRKRLFKR